MRQATALLFATAALVGPATAHAATIAHYVYDPAAKAIVETVSGTRTTPGGSFLAAPGPRGTAIRLDGNTTRIEGKALPRLAGSGDWTISAWVKLDALPWNEAPILDQSTADGTLFLGLDAEGHVVVQRRAGAGDATRIISAAKVQPRAWTLISASSRGGKLTIAVNGKPAAAIAAKPVAPPTGASTAEVLIGHVRAPALPYPSNAIHPLLPVGFTLEGSLGEIVIDDVALAASELRARMKGVAARDLMPASAPPLPRWQGGPGPFGAFHTTLAYDPAWDAPRRVGPNADVVVRFEHSSIQLVFWQGTNYIPAWVTENGRWYSDQFMEIYGKPRCPDGEDCEPMSDKQVRYSHVEITESTPARAVVHWRYALSEVENAKLADAAVPSDWGSWADEYWTVYPDGTAVRRQVLWTDHPERDRNEFQETIIVMPAGQRPEDNINLEALTVANLKGEAKAYSWQPRTAATLVIPTGPTHLDGVEAPMIQWVNLKSQWKPFQIVNSGPAKFEAMNTEPSMSTFEWWNHWPVAQIRSSGRPALTDDRPSHTSLSHIYWPVWHENALTMSRLLMTGLTTASASELAPLARSWVQPPRAHAGGKVVAYDPAQRAYMLTSPDADRPIELMVEASSDTPLVNPAVVVRDWKGDAAVSVDGAQTLGAKVGFVESLEGRRMIVFLPLKASKPLRITLTPIPRRQ